MLNEGPSTLSGAHYHRSFHSYSKSWLLVIIVIGIKVLLGLILTALPFIIYFSLIWKLVLMEECAVSNERSTWVRVDLFPSCNRL